MDLTAWLLKRTPPRPLVVTTRGGTASRVEVERLARLWGWREAVSPAEANLLVVAGPDSRDLARSLDTVWQAMPIPKAKAHIAVPEDADEALAAAVSDLRNPRRQRASVDDVHEGEHAMSQASRDGHDMQAHQGHDMSAMEMPGGVPMADRAGDRDGLKLDVLHVQLGPILPDWPPGLVVHTVLQGDVLQHASVDLIGSPHGRWAAPVQARRLDGCARLLAVAGWQSAAIVARRLRDQVLADELDVRGLARWARRVRRSRTLRWSLVGVGERGGEDAADRLYGWIDEALAGDDGATDPTTVQAVIHDLPRLLEGTELAGARLVIASFDVDTDLVGAHG